MLVEKAGICFAPISLTVARLCRNQRVTGVGEGMRSEDHVQLISGECQEGIAPLECMATPKSFPNRTPTLSSLIV